VIVHGPSCGYIRGLFDLYLVRQSHFCLLIKSTCMEQGTNAFGYGAVSTLGDTSFLVGVMDTEFVGGPFRFAVHNKLIR